MQGYTGGWVVGIHATPFTLTSGQNCVLHPEANGYYCPSMYQSMRMGHAGRVCSYYSDLLDYIQLNVANQNTSNTDFGTTVSDVLS